MGILLLTKTKSCSHHLYRVFLLASAPSALWLAWILHNPEKDPAFAITDSMQMDEWYQTLLLLQGTGKSLNCCSPKMFQENLNQGGEKQRAMTVILGSLFQMLLAV